VTPAANEMTVTQKTMRPIRPRAVAMANLE
jgi:hypothetical protein